MTEWLQEKRVPSGGRTPLFAIATTAYKNCRIWHVWYGTSSPEKHEIDAIGWDSDLKKWVLVKTEKVH